MSHSSDRKLALLLAGLYAVLGTLGILGSDGYLATLNLDMDKWMFYQMCRNWVFVLIATIVIYVLLRVSQDRYLCSLGEIRRLQRIHVVLSNINQAIVRIHGEQALFEVACRIAVKDGGFALAWVGRFDAGSGRVNIIAQAGEAAVLEPVPLSDWGANAGEAHCPLAMKLNQGRSWVCQDIGQSPCSAEEKQRALRLGYRSAIFLGLRPCGRLEAVIAFFAAEPGFFDANEVRVLEELAADLEFALAYAEQEKQRTRAEAALRESEVCANRILDTAPQAMLLVNREGRVVRANARAEQLFGYPVAMLNGMPVESLMPESFRSIHIAHRARFAERPAARNMGADRVLSCLNRDGVEFPAEIGLGPVTIGGEMHVVVSVADITERIRSVLALRESEQALEAHKLRLEEVVAERTAELRAAKERLRLILESSGNGLYGVDIEGKVTFINQTACEILGHPPERCMGRDIHTLVHHTRPDGSYYPQEECPLRITLREGRKVRIDNEVYWHADGHAIQVIYTAHPMYRDSDLIGAVVNFVDVTALHRAEAAQRLALSEVERLARLRSEFLANMSHEIRTPLNAVLGLAQVGERDNKGRKTQQTFRRILDAGQLLLGIVNDILDFSKIEAGKLEVEQTRFSLAETIDRSINLVAARACAKHLDFQVEEAVDLPATCYGDPLRLSQILVNLLSNAVKFTEHGKIVLRVTREGERLLFRVEDSGIGMTEIQLLRLFAPFEQADGTTTRRFGGTGLGLTISKRLVGMMGGGIRVESQPGEGSMFEVWLPLVEPSAPLACSIAGSVRLAGLGGQETASFSKTLAAHGLSVAAVPAAEAFAAPADHVVVVCSGKDDASRIEAALAGGRHIAVACAPSHACTPNMPCPVAFPHRDRVQILEWPLRARHLMAPPGSTKSMHADPAGAPRLRGISVLVVEDNEVNRLVIQEMLDGEGVKLVCAENGREALDRLRNDGADAYDLVLTDVQMPEMDGYETTHGIRELAPDLPVLGLTAHAMPEERQRCLAAGMVERLVKPVEIDALVSAIRRHVRTDRRSAETVEAPAPASAGMAVAAAGEPSGAAKPRTGVIDWVAVEARFRGKGVIDWVAVEARFRGKKAFVDRLAASMISSHAETPSRLRELARGERWDELVFLAHTLKGSCGNLGADGVHDLAEQVETAARDRRGEIVEGAERLALALEALLAALRARLREREGM